VRCRYLGAKLALRRVQNFNATRSIFLDFYNDIRCSDDINYFYFFAGERILQVILNLSKIFNSVNDPVPAAEKKKGKKFWRPSHAEASDAFVRIFPVIYFNIIYGCLVYAFCLLFLPTEW